MAFANEPTEDTSWLVGIANSAFSCLAIPGRDVVLGNGAPEDIFTVCLIRPTLYSRE